MADEDNTDVEGPSPSDIRPVSLIDEMKRSYLDYAMSVIVSRALPDVRDGLKPVHRRILFSMRENNYTPDRPYNKSARVTGDTMGKYHPHGNQAIYDALVRLAQDFSMRLPLIDGQGNFGSVDGDPPAAERYTEVRLAKPAMALLDDLENDTVDFQPNYDGREKEPVVLPAKFPNLLVNGAGGIAVGMATTIPPHNLGEVVDACIAYLDNPAIDMDELIEIVPGPDFPTGGLILGRQGIRSAYHKGRGSVLMRGRVAVEEVRKDRDALVITEIPYQVNKAAMVEKIAELVREKRIEGIADIRDESDRQGMRVVIELKRDAMADVVRNQIYRFSPLQSTFGCNMVALTGGRPEIFNLKDMIRAFTDFREEVVGRRIKFLLKKARDRAHVLVGLAIAVANIDEVIALIRKAPDPATAREQLMARDWPAKDVVALVELIADPRHKVSEQGTYRLSEEQAKAILDLRLQRLTALGRDEIGDELKGLGDQIADYLDILRSRERIVDIVKGELNALKEQFGTPRRTEIIDMVGEVEDEDLIQREDMVVTVSHKGYIKRVPLSAYRAQRRGGKGRAGMATRDEDFVSRIFIANTHTPVLFFSSRGMAYKMKVWRLPQAAPQARGKALINLLPLGKDEIITTILPLPEDETSWAKLDVMFATNDGSVRRNKLSDFIEVRQNGKIAMKLDEGDHIVGVEVCSVQHDVLLTSRDGQAIRFPVDDVRVFKGRMSTGVRGIRLGKGDELISMSILGHVEASAAERSAYVRQANMVRRGGVDYEPDIEPDAEGEEAVVLSPERYAELSAHEEFVLTISENGYGKRSSAYEFRVSGRGGKGIIGMVVNKRNGKLVASFPAEDRDQVMLVTDRGQLIRIPVDGISIVGRSTQGVIVFDTAQDERVVSVEHIPDENGSGAVEEVDEVDEIDEADETDGNEPAPDEDSPDEA
ncbi:MAG: DNA gyrase subunit A [Methyloceanibacter sp.]|uniref:DNA gyrase subunit A n=1 Tax=Methyloceanibacter sp. TaxID=1965321 RepID=UPI003EE219F2